MLPFVAGTPPEPSVDADDRVMRAVELMACWNRDRIAVVLKGRLVGIVRLDQALDKLGLQKPVE